MPFITAMEQSMGAKVIIYAAWPNEDGEIDVCQ